jgi:CubicO group peptidase (beta-lactamase class C family)
MKTFKRILLLVSTILLLAIFYNYPKLNIIAGYSAKSTASSVFLANRPLEFTDTKDNSFSPVNLADDYINTEEKSATSSAFGLLKRKAIFREGIGSALLTKNFDPNTKFKTPNRTFLSNNLSFPYGNNGQKDSVFSNIDYNKLNNAVNSIFNDSTKTRAVIVVHKDHIIAEKYDDGLDKNSRLLGWSMTKSITSTMFGILQCQGKINVQDAAPIEEWKNDERKNITIHNLLQMNSGLEWVEDYNSISDVTKMLFLEEDMTKLQINKPFVGKPNETWNYSSGTTNLLSGILRKQFSTHQEYLDFWYSNLIDKIGMNSMLIETDLSGNYVGSSYAWATARDWSKLGLLYLHNGNWNGENIFDEDWVKYATTPTPTSDDSYGAQIWLNTGGKYPNVTKNLYSFNGYQGQYVFILPEQDLVVVRLGLTKKFDIDAFLSGIVQSIK